MANLVLTVLSVTIGLFFILSGTLKLNPFISDELYREMVTNYLVELGSCCKEMKIYIYTQEFGKFF